MCIQLACSWRPRAFEEAHCRNIQAKFCNEKFPLVWTRQLMRLTTWRTRCYFEAQVWKKDSNIVPSLFFSHFFLGPSFFFFGPFFLFFFLAFLFFLIGQCSNNDDHHTSIDYNIRITTQNLEQDMTLYECPRRCTEICNDPRVTCMKELWMVALPQILSQLDDHAKQYDNDERVMINWMVESCMAIYLGMAMEMP